MIPPEIFELLCLYEDRGWALVPVRSGEKRSVIKDWPSRQFGIGDIDPTGNIGIKLGARSGNLVDADLDAAEAIELAGAYLPRTGAIFGRVSKPSSHWLYVAAGAVFEAFTDPIDGSTLLELRADGATGGCHQTIVPPSIADGQRREWSGASIEPAIVNPKALRICMARLAIGCLTMRYVSEYAARRPGPDLLKVLWEFDPNLGRAAYRWLDQPDPETPRRVPKPRHERSERDIALDELAAAIPNDMAWSDWNSVGMAFYAASGGSDEGFVAFDHFSAKSAKYEPHAVEERWRNYGRSPPSRIGIGTLIHLARRSGWKPAARAA